ncbi:NADP-dependent oxidoreductase domain-containing protein [Mycena albidolilacea]|uniref:NADP-dependent oxidoreductase domain-containing protein n=1 Tax=Mycena albidolilacea TaxID=1033008 RepID=A0AAD6ZLI8_9AGAR|nr:NADP-dependent oxidoreductase domain-containing protein [Mycena albidolilacea]
MSWDLLTLNDGYTAPGIAVQTALMHPGQPAVDQLRQAFDIGFSHIEISANFVNTAHVGQALRACTAGRPRSSFFVTAHWLRSKESEAAFALKKDLKDLGLDYVDLYLLNDPNISKQKIPNAWAKMERIKDTGLAKSIGVVDFDESQLMELIIAAKIRPAVNKIVYHPDNAAGAPVGLCDNLGITVLTYKIFTPLNTDTKPRTLLENPLAQMTHRLQASPYHVLLAWAKSKGVVPVLSRSDIDKLKGSIEVSHLETALTPVDLNIIDLVGTEYLRRHDERKMQNRALQKAIIGKGVGTLLNAVPLPTGN